MENGLVLDMPMNGNLLDYSGKGNHGVTSNKVEVVAGMSGQAMDFDGYNSYALTSQGMDYETYTFCFWVYPATVPTGGWNPRILSPYLGGHWIIWTTNSGIGFYSGAKDPTAAPVSQWTHYAITCNRVASQASVYRNGRLVATGTAPVAQATQSQWIIAHAEAVTTPTYDSYGGRLAGLRVYNKILTHSQIVREYNRLARDKSNV